MRKGDREKFFEILSTLVQANKAILSSFAAGQVEDVLQLLSQCQQLGITLGEMLEKYGSEDPLSEKRALAVHVLEKYCDTCFNLYRALTEGIDGLNTQTREIDEVNVTSSETVSLNAFSGEDGIVNVPDTGNTEINIISVINEGVGQLNRQLSEVYSIVSDLPIKREVVFLPYQASMWDCLESVWKEESSDPNCDAYVIPIPYYDKNPDGSFRERHYDFDRYPKYVPVLDYRKYNLKKQHPDRIYIHNPYDENNYVTTIEPYFYTKRIREYTDELIYIPYFVLEDTRSRDEKFMEWMQHFVIMPGVLYADKVIVQSEEMRSTYIDVLCHFLGEEGRPEWEKKIVGTGSPKYVKLLNTKKEEVEIPEDWKEFIYASDGSRKKIILYNTGVGAMLDNEEKMLIKIKDVFLFFKKRNDVALLWRPHPLIQSTLSSMRPDLFKKYLSLIDWYKEEKIGIYDDSADLDRALVLSDAYYGDGSSLVSLCKKAGIPAMIQDVSILYEDDNYGS